MLMYKEIDMHHLDEYKIYKWCGDQFIRSHIKFLRGGDRFAVVSKENNPYAFFASGDPYVYVPKEPTFMDMVKGAANEKHVKEKPGWTIKFMPEPEDPNER